MSKKSSNPVVSLTSGCIAGAVEAMCVWPLEFVKASRVHNSSILLTVIHYGHTLRYWCTRPFLSVQGCCPFGPWHTAARCHCSAVPSGVHKASVGAMWPLTCVAVPIPKKATAARWSLFFCAIFSSVLLGVSFSCPRQDGPTIRVRLDAANRREGKRSCPRRRSAHGQL